MNQHLTLTKAAEQRKKLAILVSLLCICLVGVFMIPWVISLSSPTKYFGITFIVLLMFVIPTFGAFIENPRPFFDAYNRWWMLRALRRGARIPESRLTADGIGRVRSKYPGLFLIIILILGSCSVKSSAEKAAPPDLMDKWELIGFDKRSNCRIYRHKIHRGLVWSVCEFSYGSSAVAL